MYVRITSIQTTTDKIDEAISIYQHSVVPALQQQAGFRSTMLVTDRAKGQGRAISVWESAEALLASEASGFYQEQVAKFAPLLSAAPVREVFDAAVVA